MALDRPEVVLDAFRQAYAGVRSNLAAALGQAGFELEAAEPADGGETWTIRVRVSGTAAPAARPVQRSEAVQAARVAAPATQSADVRAEPVAQRRPAAAAPASPPPPAFPEADDPARRAKPVALLQGDTLSSLAARESAGLMVGVSSGDGGITIAPLSRVKQGELLAATLVGDAFLDLRHRKVDETDEFAVAEVAKQYLLFVEASERIGGKAESTLFLRALDAWAPASFPRGRDFLQRAQ